MSPNTVALTSVVTATDPAPGDDTTAAEASDSSGDNLVSQKADETAKEQSPVTEHGDQSPSDDDEQNTGAVEAPKSTSARKTCSGKRQVLVTCLITGITILTASTV